MTLHVAFEGIDNCGKTTLCLELSKVLSSRGRTSHVSKEFSTDYGHLLKTRLYNPSITPSCYEKALAFALDRLIRIEVLATTHYDVVFWDRYVLSALVYRGVENADISWIEAMNSIFPTPHTYIYLDITPQEARNRGEMAGKLCPYSETFLALCRMEYLKYVDIGKLTKLQSSTIQGRVTEVLSLIEQIIL